MSSASDLLSVASACALLQIGAPDVIKSEQDCQHDEAETDVDPGEDSEAETDARSTSLIGRKLLPSAGSRPAASSGTGKIKTMRAPDTSKSPSAAVPSKSIASAPEAATVPEASSVGGKRRSTIDTTIDGRLLRLKQGVEEETATTKE